MIDFIGDIHGQADKLKALLHQLGYHCQDGCYAHSERKVIFVGDYIDRGPQIVETLDLVKKMTEHGSAIALMGNHEYNALCFHYQEREGGHLRKHLIKNIIQHYETLRQFQNKQKEYESYLEWFKTLPLFYETDTFRAVHACWDIEHIHYLQENLKNNRLTDELIYLSVERGNALNIAIEETLKGKEIKMPDGLDFTDKDGTKRNSTRIKWWEDPQQSTYKGISMEPTQSLPDIAIDVELIKNTRFYDSKSKPVFFGHYWLRGNPMLYRDNICCLDYSVARNGYLAAYRFDGEAKLDSSKFVYV